MASHVLRIQLLGGFRVELDGRLIPAEGWRRRRAAALVKLLALAGPHHRLPRDAVIDALWPDLDAAAGGANLRKAAHHARRTLGVDRAIILDGATVQLLPGAQVSTDVVDFERRAREALARRDVDLSRRAASSYPGDLLPDDRYDAWCDQRRATLQALYREVLAAGGLWGRLLAVEPTNEVAHRAVIRGRLDARDRAGAIRQFDRMRSVLREQLGVGPDPESVALHEEVLAFEGRDVPTPSEGHAHSWPGRRSTGSGRTSTRRNVPPPRSVPLPSTPDWVASSLERVSCWASSHTPVVVGRRSSHVSSSPRSG